MQNYNTKAQSVALHSSKTFSVEFVYNFQVKRRTSPCYLSKATEWVVKDHHFKMGSLHHMTHLLPAGRFMTTIDLKPIHCEHSKYLWFEWNSNLLEFTCCRLAFPRRAGYLLKK